MFARALRGAAAATATVAPRCLRGTVASAGAAATAAAGPARCWRRGPVRAQSSGPAAAATASGSEALQPTAGPDAPLAGEQSLGQPRWPAGWHDSLQYHFFFEGLFVHARVFLTPSLEETSVWIFDHEKGHVEELLNSGEALRQTEGQSLSVSNSRVQIEDGPGGGSLVLAAANGGGAEMRIDFQNEHLFFWLPAGQGKDAVIHRPDLKVSISFRGRKLQGRGYSKRYYGAYGPHWGYRFIQSSSLGGRYFLWTADATFRLGDGEAKYNYFKLLDSETGELTQADSRDTWQQDCMGFALIGGERYEASVEPLGEWMHDFRKGDTNSRMQLRYCRVRVSRGANLEPLEGYALNERCFGVL